MTGTPLQQLRALLEKHCTTLRGQMAEFETAYRRSGPDKTAMNILHTLKGGSGTMGFADIHERMTALESHLLQHGAAAAADTAVLAETDARIDELRAMIGRMRPEQSRHYDLQL